VFVAKNLSYTPTSQFKFIYDESIIATYGLNNGIKTFLSPFRCRL